ncbi:MAG TPA: heme-binding protein [Solirubrobacteraceae bacterium]|nr:heme-binding protein [Solirubrobacteraceae bacterium]
MTLPESARTTDLPLADARRLIARAIDKAEDIAMRGAVAVIGASGALVSASRMDHGGAGGMARARSKAWIGATQQIRSTEHLQRLGHIAPPMVAGFSACSPEAVFPGAGGMPITRDGWVVGGIAASGAGIGPFVDYPGAEPQKLIAGGRPANGEDLLVHYALGIPYEGQHGDDLARWVDAYGSFPEDPGDGLGMADPPPASRQHEYRWALVLADRAIAEAQARGHAMSVTIADARGEPIQQDRMDGAPAASVALSEGTAAAAATFACPSGGLADRYGGDAKLALIAAALPYRIMSVPGGVPIVEGGSVVAAIGVGGSDPVDCNAIATAVAGLA